MMQVIKSRVHLFSIYEVHYNNLQFLPKMQTIKLWVVKGRGLTKNMSAHWIALNLKKKQECSLLRRLKSRSNKTRRQQEYRVYSPPISTATFRPWLLLPTLKRRTTRRTNKPPFKTKQKAFQIPHIGGFHQYGQVDVNLTRTNAARNLTVARKDPSNRMDCFWNNGTIYYVEDKSHSLIQDSHDVQDLTNDIKLHVFSTKHMVSTNVL